VSERVPDERALDHAALDALSPVDGRYRDQTTPLRGALTERSLIVERIRVEAAWFLFLCQRAPMLRGSNCDQGVQDRAAELADHPPTRAAEHVKELEATVNHDVKAVEYYVRRCLAESGASDESLELVHFGCTSDDVTNTSYARMLARTRKSMLDLLDELIEQLVSFAHEHADDVMLARTHGQAASPTTMGKEVANFAYRLRRLRNRWSATVILGKWNGAVGNFNAHVAAVPELDWPALTAEFVESLGLENNSHTAQIEPHDWIGEYCDALAAINVVLLDFCRDMWSYVALGYFRQAFVATDVGSSTMPHKVNPVEFENAEGNLGVSNALLKHFSEKLPISRWQRDLSDSTVLRNLGVAIAHSLIAWQAVAKGARKLESDRAKLLADVSNRSELLSEAIQTVLRAAGVPNGYETMKAATRGRSLDAERLAGLIESLPIPAPEKDRLRALTPETYTGLARELARKL
jgi:adenylosuccinate lyase